MRVLIIKISSMGDILHTLPSLTDAMKKIPNIHFDWVIEEEFKRIPEWHKAVDQVIPIAIRRWRKKWFSSKIRDEWSGFKEVIHKRHYDVAIDAQGLIKSAVLISNLTHCVKHGMNWKTAREPLASLFYNKRHYIKTQAHAVERIRELFAKSLGYSIPKNKGNYAILHHFLHKKQLENSPYIVLLHSASRNDKCWPETHWRNLIRLIQKVNDFSVKLLWMNEHEYRRAKFLASNFLNVEIFPKLSLDEIAEKLIHAKFVISVDTGLSHLASALNRPNITLFGPTNPILVGGYGKNQYQVISPTRKMQDISAENVFTILQKNFML